MENVYLKEPNGTLYPVMVIAVSLEYKQVIIQLTGGQQKVVKTDQLVSIETKPAF